MTTEIRFFTLKRKKNKVLDRGQSGFYCEDNNNDNNTNIIGVIIQRQLRETKKKHEKGKN